MSYNPNVIPAGGTTGQVPKKNSSTDFDISWGTPAGGGDVVGPGSSTDNALTRFDGTSGGAIQNSGVLLSDDNDMSFPVVASTPAVAAADKVRLFATSLADMPLMAMRSSGGTAAAIQSDLSFNQCAFWLPAGNGGTLTTVGMGTITTTGFTTATRNVATTNIFTRQRRWGGVTASTANTVGQFRNSAQQYSVGDGAGLGGFLFQILFGISDAASVANARMFIGMKDTGVPSNVEPSTLTNCFGVGHGSSDSNLKFFYGGSSAQTPIDLGANFPKTHGSAELYDLILYSSPDVANEVNYEVRRLTTGDVATGNLSGGSTVIPQSTTLMNMWGYRTNSSTALAVGLDVVGFSFQTFL